MVEVILSTFLITNLESNWRYAVQMRSTGPGGFDAMRSYFFYILSYKQFVFILKL
jgi:hypothetical protein